jgi:diguanylate cyclase (GGDEF)-like protein/PAS domain S-box-containing protein
MATAPDAPGKHRLEALRVSESRYRRLFEAARDGILLINADSAQIEDVNPYLIELLGYSHAEFLGKKLWDVGSFADRLESKAMFAELQARGYVRYESLPLKTKAGSEVQVEFVSNIYDCDGIKVIQCNVRNIAERKQLEDQMRQLALYDSLTELPNRRLLHDRLSQTMAASKRWGCHAALMYVDLDNFKTLNDAHGHAAGDLLLVEAARRLKSCVRESDTVARVGGDEFVIILSDLSADKVKSTAMAEVTAQKLRIKLTWPYLLTIRHEGKADATVEYRCTASIGVALFFNHEGSQEDILGRADVAMYQAKAAGPNLIRFFEAQA